MSKRRSSTPSVSANCLATSVLPTPVGPVNRYEPIGFSGSRRPARASLIAEERAVMAESCPNTTVFRLCSSPLSSSASDFDTDLGGMRAIEAMVVSMSSTSITCLRWSSGSSFWLAPVSSITSIALSGSLRSVM
ncbi:hypothetical protein D9M68_926040 [compost metagenome]